MNIQQGDGLVLFNGSRVIAASTPGEDSTGAMIVSCDVGQGMCVPVRLTAVVEVWRNGEQLMQQLSLFGEEL